MYATELKTVINIKEYDVHYGLNKKDLGQLGEILGNLIGNNQEEFIQRLTPTLEESISKWIILLFNDVFKSFSYDQLFPDRT